MLEHRGGRRCGENEVLADRQDERLAPILHGAHFHRVGQQRTRVGEPRRAGHDNARRGAEAVAAVVEHDRGIARQRHLIAQDDDRSGGERSRVVGVARWFAVGIVAIAPDLRVGLGRIAQIDLVAVLPVVDHDLRSRHGHGDGDDRFGDGAQAGGQHRVVLAQLLLWLRHIPLLRHGQRARRHDRTEQKARRFHEERRARTADSATGELGHDRKARGSYAEIRRGQPTARQRAGRAWGRGDRGFSWRP